MLTTHIQTQQPKNRNMINIKLHKKELQLIKESIESSKRFGNEPKLCDRVLKKLDEALTIPVVMKSFSWEK